MLSKNVTNLFLRKAYFNKNSSILRNFSVTSVNGESVKIQSSDDFKKKVINSKVPVVVDFFATYVQFFFYLQSRVSIIIIMSTIYLPIVRGTNGSNSYRVKNMSSLTLLTFKFNSMQLHVLVTVQYLLQLPNAIHIMKIIEIAMYKYV